MFEGISGHQKQIELLTKAIERNKLAHAYTFAGPSGIGKKLVAKSLALVLLSHPSSGADAPPSPAGGEGKFEENHFQPDLIELDGSEGIKIEQIRELIYKLSLKPYQAKYKVALIDSAENMTNEAANALLKTLEEPKDYTVIILITSNAGRLPKTIISRTQKINFSSQTKGEESEDEFYPIFQSQNLADKLIAAYGLAELETAEIKNILETWMNRMERELLTNATKKLAQKISQVAQARRFLDQNVNTKLLLTNLMLNS